MPRQFILDKIMDRPTAAKLNPVQTAAILCWGHKNEQLMK